METMIVIYLDYAATTPVLSDALQAFEQLSKEVYGNSSSLHDAGGKAESVFITAVLSWQRSSQARLKAFILRAAGPNRICWPSIRY